MSNGVPSFPKAEAEGEVDVGDTLRDACARSGLGADGRRERQRGFTLGCDDAKELSCVEVRGFRDAAAAASDARALVPLRLVIVGPDAAADAWLDAWAEDPVRVRRSLTLTRRFDGKEIVAVVTIAAHGYGVETSLAVESVRVPASMGPRDLFRSGVHPKAEIAAALAALEGGRQGPAFGAACGPVIEEG